MNIHEILNTEGREQSAIIEDLKKKTVNVPIWDELSKEYDKKKHPVFTDHKYLYTKSGKKRQELTQIGLGWQKASCRYISQLLFGIPVNVLFSPKTDDETLAAGIIQDILTRNRYSSLNLKRCEKMSACCEIATIWYCNVAETSYNGMISPYKVRCKTFSPMGGDALYPLFDEYDDMIALSVEYKRSENGENVTYFETYTADRHLRWRESKLELDEVIGTGKISGVYTHRELPIWEGASDYVYEAEWTLSRNGNYIRKNARPKVAIYSNKKVEGRGNDSDEVSVYRLPENSKMEYVVWQQATESIKFHIAQLREQYETEIQLPSIASRNMQEAAISGESRKMLFLEAQMKCISESGLWIEFLDREINVLRSFVAFIYPELAEAVNNVICDIIITPYQIHDISSTATMLSGGVKNKIISRRTAINYLGLARDVEAELKEILNDNSSDAIVREEEGQEMIDEPNLVY